MLPGHLSFSVTKPCTASASRQGKVTFRAPGGTLDDAGWRSPVACWAHNPEATGSNPVPATSAREGPVIPLGNEDIEEVIAKDLTRSQIAERFGVGEHAAQLARTRAVAIRGERQRCGTVPRAALSDVDVLRKEAEVYLAHRLSVVGLSLGTDRTKITLFIDWLAERNA
jgi:hypothetical protein